VPDPKYTLVYDGNCQVCNRLVVKLRRWDHRQEIELVPSQAPGVVERFPWIPASAFADAMQLIRADGSTWQGAAALEELIRVLPRGRWISWVFHVPLVRVIADWMYRWFARNRYRFGCSAHCRSIT
jgi:predicted DCC family thiol-disulfide oxidoreductase YuxK